MNHRQVHDALSVVDLQCRSDIDGIVSHMKTFRGENKDKLMIYRVRGWSIPDLLHDIYAQASISLRRRMDRSIIISRALCAMNAKLPNGHLWRMRMCGTHVDTRANIKCSIVNCMMLNVEHGGLGVDGDLQLLVRKILGLEQAAKQVKQGHRQPGQEHRQPGQGRNHTPDQGHNQGQDCGIAREFLNHDPVTEEEWKRYESFALSQQDIRRRDAQARAEWLCDKHLSSSSFPPPLVSSSFPPPPPLVSSALVSSSSFPPPPPLVSSFLSSSVSCPLALCEDESDESDEEESYDTDELVEWDQLLEEWSD